MSKRFVDTSLWGKKWYRTMPPRMKLFYFYLLTNCDHAGMYDVDLDLAEFQIGMEVKQKDIDKHLKEHIEVVKEDKWFIKKFPDFQYGELNPNVKAHASVIKILTKYNCLQRVSNTYASVQDKDKDKDKVKDKEKGKMDTSILNVGAAHKKTIGYREVQFKNKISDYAEDYPKDMRIQFADYWTESSGNKMRFEKEKVFDIGRRLARWSKNNFNKKEELPNFSLDSTGKFYLAWCSKCNKNDSYSQFELKQDSRCCQAKLMDKKR